MRDALAALHPPDPRHPFPPRDPARPKGHNVLGLLALHPTLATAYHTFNGHVLFATTLSVRQRELLVLRVAHRRDGAYEWAQHAVLAADAGITADELERIRRPTVTEADGWSALDAAVLHAADELIDDARIGEATWAALVTGLDSQQILDLIFTVGAYDVLAMALRSFDVPLDDDLRA
jgi:alkylhydroperoxidase family enzyme